MKRAQLRHDNLLPPEDPAPHPDSETIYQKFQPAYGEIEEAIKDSLDNLLVSGIGSEDTRDQLIRDYRTQEKIDDLLCFVQDELIKKI